MFEQNQHQVAENEIVFTIKICENCGRNFTKRRSDPKIVEKEIASGSNFDHGKEKRLFYLDTGRKYCVNCCSKMLLPVDDEVYRQAVPQFPRRSLHLIHYDDSMITTEQPKKAISSYKKVNASKGRIRVPLCQWKDAILQASVERNGLTAEDMVDLVPNCFTPKDAYMRVKRVLSLIVIGEKPSQLRGRKPKIYMVTE